MSSYDEAMQAAHDAHYILLADAPEHADEERTTCGCDCGCGATP